MPVIALNETSDCSNPILDVFIRELGILVDVVQVEWLIEDVTTGTPVQIEPASGRNTANVAACPAGDRVSTGRYVATFTIPPSFNLGVHRLTWFFRKTLAGQEFRSQEEFEVLSVSVPGANEIYCTVQDIRDEGITVAQASDGFILKRLVDASRFIDKITGRFFLPHTEEYFLDGRGHSQMLLEEPIIAIAEVEVTVEGINFTDAPLDLNDVAVYNRHLSQNLTRPDDRDNPRIAFKRSDKEFARLHALLGQRVFYKGRQNIRVSGVFGYTDPDGTSTGKTPDLIGKACKLITIQSIAPFGDLEASQEAASAGNIRRLKTRDQEIEYQNVKGVGELSVGPFTGDFRIDNILLMYMRPMDIATV